MVNRIETSLLVKGLTADTYALDVRGKTFVGGDIEINGNVNIVGTATTINTQTVQARDNKIELNYSGSTSSAIGGGIEILSGRTDGSGVSLTIDTDRDWNSNTGFNITGRTSDSTTNGLKVVNSLGTDNLVVRNDGNVGIGTSTPSQTLNIYKSGFTQANLLIESDSYTSNIILNSFKNSQGTSGGSTINFKSNGVTYGDISTVSSNSRFIVNSSNGYDLFLTNANSAIAVSNQTIRLVTNNENRLIVLNDGNVGIGTSTPTAKLHLSGTTPFISENTTDGTSTGLIIRSSDSGFDNGQELRLDFQQQTSSIGKIASTFFGGQEFGFKFYGLNNSGFLNDLITFRGSGNVGIGTSTPSSKLHVVGPNSSSPTALFESNATNDTSYTVRAIATTTNTQSNVGLYSYVSGGFANLGLWVEEGLSCFGPFNSDSKVYIKGIDSSSSNYGLKVQNSGGTNTLQVRNDGLITVNDVTNGSDSSNSVRFYQTIPATGTYNYGFYSAGAPTYANYAAVGNTSRTHFYSSESPKTAYEADMAATVSSPYRAGFGASVIGINTGGTNVALYSDVRNGVSNYTIYSVNGDSFFNKTSMTLNGKTNGSDSVFSVNNSGGTNTLQVRNDGLLQINTPTLSYGNLITVKAKDALNDSLVYRDSTDSYDIFKIKGDGYTTARALNIDAPLYPLINFINQYSTWTIERGGYNLSINEGITERLFMASGGNVGFSLGATPEARIHIKGSDSSSSNYGLKVQDSGGTDNLVVRNDGNVGIGTSTPTEKLEVSGKTKTTTLQVTSGATSGYVLTATDSNGNMSWQSSIKKYSTTLTTPTTGNYTITHNLDTTDISVTLWLVTTDEMTNANINTRTTNSVTVSFLSDVEEDVRVVVIG